MKASFFFVSYILILITSLLKCNNKTLLFCNEKHIYWLALLTITTIVFVFKKEYKTLKINTYDTILFFLVFLGLINFVFISNATVYTISIWHYTGYLTIYLLLRDYCITTDLNKKALEIILSFCSLTAIINVFWLFLQWKNWVASPNVFFRLTGLFFSPNNLGLFLSIGCISTLFLLQKTKVLGLKIAWTLVLLLFICGIIISESRGAIISLSIALTYFFYHSKIKNKQYWNWKIYLGIGIVIIGSVYYISTLSAKKIDSTSGRYFTTQQILKQIAQKPLGYGLNSFSVDYNKNKAHYFKKNHNWDEMKNAGYLFYANNDFLELTFELGIHWIVLFMVFTFLLFSKKHSTIETLLCKTIILCIALFSLTNSISSEPVFMIIAIIATSIFINESHSKTLYTLKTNFIFKPIAIGLLLFAIIIQSKRLNTENNLCQLYQGNKYLKGENQLQEYLCKIEENGEEWFIAGIVLIKNGYKKEAIQYMQIGFQRSGKPSLGRILAESLQKQGDYTQAENIYLYNKNVEPYRYEARMDLFNLFIITKQNTKAKKMAMEIINLPIKIHSSKIIAYKNEAKLYLKGISRQ